MFVANVSHSASMTHIHACFILLLMLIHSMQHAMLYRKKFPATVATVKCPSDCNNCDISYNYLSFNRRISLYAVTQSTKTEDFLSVLKSNFLKPLPLVLRFFLPPRQDIATFRVSRQLSPGSSGLAMQD